MNDDKNVALLTDWAKLLYAKAPPDVRQRLDDAKNRIHSITVEAAHQQIDIVRTLGIDGEIAMMLVLIQYSETVYPLVAQYIDYLKSKAADAK